MGPEGRFSRLIAGAARATRMLSVRRLEESKTRARARQGLAGIGRTLGQGKGWREEKAGTRQWLGKARRAKSSPIVVA